MSQDDILKRLKDLERENQQLKKIVGQSPAPKETTTHVSMFKGHPVITFSGPFRPFTLGIRKSSVILEKLNDLKHFVDNNKKHLTVGQDDPPETTPV